MTVLNLILITLSLVLLLEGLFIYFIPKSSRQALIAMFKNQAKSKKLGLIEIIIGLLLLLISTY
ncbi:MAG: DUF2065 family protein [Nanoarchaeota archaeon]